LEATLLNVPIICPNYKHIIPDMPNDYFEDFRDAVNYITSYSDFEDLFLSKVKVKKPNVSVKSQILSPLIYSLDGKSSKRVEEHIIKTIEQCNL
jgi:hypothetical protein